MRDKGVITPEELDEARASRRKEGKTKRKKAEKQEEQVTKEDAREQAEEARKLKLYRRNLRRAQNILYKEEDVTDEKINEAVRKLINFAVTPLGRKHLKKEDASTITNTLFGAIQMDIKKILGVAKLWVIIKDYQKSIFVLNYSKNFFEREEDLKRIEKAVEMVTIYRKKIQADQLFRAGRTLEEVARTTNLSVTELIKVKNGTLPLELYQEDINGAEEQEQ